MDRDMVIVPDLSTLRRIPWAVEPTATVMMDCSGADGQSVDVAPRAVLKSVIAHFESQGWRPVVAPEVEFYLSTRVGAPNADDLSRSSDHDFERVTDPYGTNHLHDLRGFFMQLTDCCRAQDIALGAVSQELGAGQFEVNFEHGAPLKLADDVFHFKRTLKHLAKKHGMRATFLAKLDSTKPGSSLHLHQSVYDRRDKNIFSGNDGKPTDAFHGYLGGLQKHMADFLLLFAPYPNSYRRFLSHWSSPTNLEWGVDNRTVGFRVPDSEPAARRIENRLAGSDVNPYLAFAGTLACGFLGMTEGAECRRPVPTSAWDLPFALHRHPYEALDALRRSPAVQEMLGQAFVAQYAGVKEREWHELDQRVPSWELEELSVLI
ncbi:MAG: glutamine synthetase family protein [Woeseia sp.]